MAISGWLAFQRGACLAWLDRPTVRRSVVQAVLEGSFLTVLATVAEDDAALASALGRLAPSERARQDGGAAAGAAGNRPARRDVR